MATAGLIAMFGSVYVAIRLPVVSGILVYYIAFLAGFISLLYGTGYILLANNLWGS